MSEHRMTIPALRDPYHGTVHWVTDSAHGWLVVQAESVRASRADISSYSYISPDGAWAYLEEDCDAPAYLAAMGLEPDGDVGLAHHTDGESYVRELSPWQ